MSIQINDLTVTFKNHVTAIDHASLEIPTGIFGLLGENGAGKTTLMRVLTTTLSPDSGTVSLDGTKKITPPSKNGSAIFRRKSTCIRISPFRNA